MKFANSPIIYILIFFYLIIGHVEKLLSQPTDSLIHISDIRIRDPFIYVDHKKKLYYMYAQLDNRLDGIDNPEKPKGVEVYTSKDLKNWTFPQPVLKIPENFWARSKVWAPEVFKYENKYYLFVTLTSQDTLKHKIKPPELNNWPELRKRGTQIFYSENLVGPFQPFANKPHTPKKWMALDGTLYIEENVPYMIFCHEWVQIQEGTVNYIRLKNDLSKAIGEPELMFKATETPWCNDSSVARITDGPFLYRSKTGRLIMIWSTNGIKGYAVVQAYSLTGKLNGPWKQIPKPLFRDNGGHGMIFKTLEDELVLAIHQPNNPRGIERLKLFHLIDEGDRLIISGNYFEYKNNWK